jgi:predicted transcriptional regulator
MLCKRVKQPRAAIIREAVAEYLERRATKPTEAAYGLWGAEAMDGLAYQEEVRADWLTDSVLLRKDCSSR